MLTHIHAGLGQGVGRIAVARYPLHALGGTAHELLVVGTQVEGLQGGELPKGIGHHATGVEGAQVERHHTAVVAQAYAGLATPGIDRTGRSVGEAEDPVGARGLAVARKAPVLAIHGIPYLAQGNVVGNGLAHGYLHVYLLLGQGKVTYRKGLLQVLSIHELTFLVEELVVHQGVFACLQGDGVGVEVPVARIAPGLGLVLLAVGGPSHVAREHEAHAVDVVVAEQVGVSGLARGPHLGQQLGQCGAERAVLHGMQLQAVVGELRGLYHKGGIAVGHTHLQDVGHAALLVGTVYHITSYGVLAGLQLEVLGGEHVLGTVLARGGQVECLLDDLLVVEQGELYLLGIGELVQVGTFEQPTVHNLAELDLQVAVAVGGLHRIVVATGGGQHAQQGGQAQHQGLYSEFHFHCPYLW